MIYSRWRPDTGGFDYFEGPERLGIADDLAKPALPSGTAIGVPSTEAGRPMPITARKVGSGEVAKGVIVPMSRMGLGAVSVSMSTGGVLALFAGAALGVYLYKRGVL